MYEIYKITNKVNGMLYIGYTSLGLKERFRHHAKCKKSVVSQAIREYGKENFEIACIDTAENKSEAIKKEKEWTIFYKSNDPQVGYNIAIGFSHYGHSVSDETKRKLSERNKGKQGLRGKDNPKYGMSLSDETRKRISESLKGRYTGEKNPFYGQKHGEDFRQKVCGENHWTTRKEFSEETRKKMSAAQSGAKSNNHKACMCIETGETFPYVKAVTLKYGFNDCHIHSVCKGKRKRCGGFHWKYISDDEVIHNKEE